MSSCTVLVTVTVTVFCFLHIALAQYPKAPVGYAEEVFHRHSISTYRNPNRNYPRVEDNRRNSKSMSFIDYFFPSSRTAKVSNVFDSPKTNTSDKTTTNAASTMIEKLSSLASVVVEQTTDPIPYSTREEGRATGSTKKGTSTTKRKTSSVHQPSTTPKTKNTQKTSSQSTSYQTSLKNVQRATTPKPADKNTSPNKTPTASSASSQKTTHKHYTIYPSVITSKTNPPTSIYKSKQPESTTAKIASASSVQSSTAQKVTVAELGKVTTTPTEKTTSSAGTSPAESAATDLDGREGEYELKDKQTQANNVKINEQTKKETVPLPAGSTSVLAKPTKYHYYPHNQHIYLLPECAIQQVCNAVYVRLNYTQPLCACPARHRDPCSASLNADDLHTTQLTTDSKKKYAHKAVTLVKTCEATSEMRECRAPRDWSLLALQNVRTGKSHYLVICRCPQEFILEGPMSHDQPTYASVPGIRVYGMMCVQPQNQFSTTGYNSVTSRPSTSSYKIGYSQPHYNQDQSTSRFPGYIGPGVYYNRMARRIRDTSRMSKKFNHANVPPFPWEKAKELALTADWEN